MPLIYAAGVARRQPAAGPGQFFFILVFPYLVVLLMAYVGSRVVYRLGAAVRKAREMGSYRLVERLGEGGMGEVWRAQHRLLARPAAIKLIRPEVLGATDAGEPSMLSGGSSARRRRRRSCARPTRWSSTTSAWPTTARSTT